MDYIIQSIQKNNAVLIDVREKSEYDDGHFLCAKNVPLSEIQKGNLSEIPHDKKVYLHCRSGNRVHVAKYVLESDFGYINIEVIPFSIPEMQNLGFRYSGN